MRVLVLTAIAAAVLAVSVRWGSFVAGGPDSYCYVHQAQQWAAVLTGSGPLLAVEPLALEAPWPDAAATFVPVGHAPSPSVAGAIVPICPSGLSIAMAPFAAAGGPAAVFAVVPLFGVALILATHAVGSRFGARVGLAAALLTACSPVFLYQVVQPMSDVPAAALWMLAVAAATGTGRRHALWSGLATSGAILMRPNLVPLGFALGLYHLLRPERTWAQRLRAALVYAAASAPGCVAVAALQATFFGSPLASGYGSFDALFGAAHVWPNLQRYAQWLADTHTPAIALVMLAPWLLPGTLAALCLAMFAVNLALYLPYLEFEHWSFLRFLLPTLPLVFVLVAAVVDAAIGRLASGLSKDGSIAPARDWGPARSVAVAIAAIALDLVYVRTAEEGQAFRLQRLEARFERAGVFVRDRLPPNAFLVTSWHSGSARFYGGRKTLDWTSLDGAWLDRTIAFLENRGYEPYLMFERWEEPQFRRQFRGAAVADLDWPPAAEVAAQVRIYRPRDRERYLRGESPPTEYVR